MLPPSSDEIDRQRETVTDDILPAISDAENTDEIELSPPLYEVIDLDALDRLVRNADETVQVSFQYRQCEVAVRGDGVVDVTKPPDDV